MLSIRTIMVGSLAISAVATAAEKPHDFGGATPIRPETWITERDYPKNARADGQSGLVRFAFDISPAGRVENCVVTLSSGYAALDAAPCRLLTERARFEPRKDEQGQPIATKGRSQVFWRR